MIPNGTGEHRQIKFEKTIFFSSETCFVISKQSRSEVVRVSKGFFPFPSPPSSHSLTSYLVMMVVGGGGGVVWLADGRLFCRHVRFTL